MGWIDAGTRSNGWITTDLIDNPAFIIESLIRDEVCSLKDQVITSVSGLDLTCDDLPNKPDDYYNGATFIYTNQSYKCLVTDYVSATNTLTVDGGIPNPGDNFVLLNIKGDDKIDITSFDLIGNTTDGLRKDWKFAKSINSQTSVKTLINEICFESHCIFLPSSTKYVIKALDTETVVDTWSNPLKKGRELIKGSMTSIDNVYTSFVLKYNYDPCKKEYTKQLSVDSSGFTGFGTLGITEQNLCKEAKVIRNGRNNPFTYSCNWINDDFTAEQLLIKLVLWNTKQHFICHWSGDFGSYMKYEIGDQVKINFPKYVTGEIGTGTKFMIFKKTINQSRVPTIDFSLMEMPVMYAYRITSDSDDRVDSSSNKIKIPL